MQVLILIFKYMLERTNRIYVARFSYVNNSSLIYIFWEKINLTDVILACQVLGYPVISTKTPSTGIATAAMGMPREW